MEAASVSGAILYLLSASLEGQSRQVAMYLVGYNVLICAVLVPLLYCEIHFDVPLMKASILAFDLDLDQQLALVYVFLCAFLLPVMLPGLKWSALVLERLWPTSQADELRRPQFIHDHASVDVDTSLVLVDLEQRRATKDLSQYFDAVRRGATIEPLRDSTRKLLSDITEFLDDLQTFRPMHGVEGRNYMRNRQKLLGWLEDALGFCARPWWISTTDPYSLNSERPSARASMAYSLRWSMRWSRTTRCPGISRGGSPVIAAK